MPLHTCLTSPAVACRFVSIDETALDGQREACLP
jgi:hypothetical protein